MATTAAQQSIPVSQTFTNASAAGLDTAVNAAINNLCTRYFTRHSLGTQPAGTPANVVTGSIIVGTVVVSRNSSDQTVTYVQNLQWVEMKDPVAS